MMKNFWKDDCGALASAEIVLIGTILVIGVIAGLTSLRDAVVTELADLAGAIAALNQSYSYNGVQAHHVITYGSAFDDKVDYCDLEDGVGSNSKCLVLSDAQAPTPESPPGP